MYIVPAQWAWVLEESGITAEEASEAAWVVRADGTKERGAAAISVVFDEVIGFGPIIFTIYRVPGIRQIEDWAYQLVASNRTVFSRWFSSTPAIKQKEWRPEQ